MAVQSVAIGVEGGKRKRYRSPEYMSWQSMKDRCTNPKYQYYSNYGGRGITVCERWKNSFAAFLEDMGPRPTRQHSIDRKENDGNYEPGNCQWSTRLEQGSNKRNNRLYIFYGKAMTLPQWCRISQISRDVVKRRLQRGWPEKEAFWTPTRVHVMCDVKVG